MKNANVKNHKNEVNKARMPYPSEKTGEIAAAMLKRQGFAVMVALFREQRC
jgi:hypothetical protein